MNKQLEQNSVERFLKANRKEVEDNGFSKRVLHHLPDRYERVAWIIRGVGGIALLTLFWALGGIELLHVWMQRLIEGVSNSQWTLNLSSNHAFISFLCIIFIVGICKLTMKEE